MTGRLKILTTTFVLISPLFFAIQCCVHYFNKIDNMIALLAGNPSSRLLRIEMTPFRKNGALVLSDVDSINFMQSVPYDPSFPEEGFSYVKVYGYFVFEDGTKYWAALGLTSNPNLLLVSYPDSEWRDDEFYHLEIRAQPPKELRSFLSQLGLDQFKTPQK